MALDQHAHLGRVAADGGDIVLAAALDKLPVAVDDDKRNSPLPSKAAAEAAADAAIADEHDLSGEILSSSPSAARPEDRRPASIGG